MAENMEVKNLFHLLFKPASHDWNTAETDFFFFFFATVKRLDAGACLANALLGH